MYVRVMSSENQPDTVGAEVGEPISTPPVLARVTEDEALSKTDLVEVIAHCASTIAAAQFRLLKAVSLIHEEHEEDYGAELGELTSGAAGSSDALHEFTLRGRAGEDPRAQYGPNGLERAIADVGAVLSVPPGRARELIVDAHALRYRLPYTSSLLACGRIDLQRFHIAVARTSLCGPDTIDEVDARLAAALSSRDHMSTTRFKALVDSIVAHIDTEAVKRRRARVDTDRNVEVRPDRFTPGQSRLTGTVPAASGALINQRLDALACSVHDADPRTRAQRRADALTAFADGQTTLECRCEACAGRDDSNSDAAQLETTGADTTGTGPNSTAPANTGHRNTGAQPAPLPAGPRAIIHVVANQSTLDGDDDAPGYLDGYGIIDADAVRELAADAQLDYLNNELGDYNAGDNNVGADAIGVFHSHHNGDGDGELPADSEAAALRYVPSKKLLALVRSGELCCTFPGCANPVWTADIDHGEPFNHRNPRAGGLTIRRNLKPLCRFHHRLKTFGRWRDYRPDLKTALFVSPTGHSFVGNSFSGLDLFPGLLPDKPPDHPARRAIDSIHDTRRAEATRVTEKWNTENPPPF